MAKKYHFKEVDIGNESFILPFKFQILFLIYFSTDNDTCQCKRCKKNRKNEWPYELSLSANLLHLTGLHIDDINYTEVTKFEETLVAEYLRHISEFWKYITELCLIAGDNGLEILSQFNNGLFDKPFIYDRRHHIPRPNIPNPNRNKRIIKYCKQKYRMIHGIFDN